jgi:hypothetical protein
MLVDYQSVSDAECGQNVGLELADVGAWGGHTFCRAGRCVAQSVAVWRAQPCATFALLPALIVSWSCLLDLLPLFQPHCFPPYSRFHSIRHGNALCSSRSPPYRRRNIHPIQLLRVRREYCARHVRKHPTPGLQHQCDQHLPALQLPLFPQGHFVTAPSGAGGSSFPARGPCLPDKASSTRALLRNSPSPA